MEPTTLIMTALATGAAAGASTTASEAIKDAYDYLKEIVSSKFSGKPEAKNVLIEHKQKPDIWVADRLKEVLIETGADQDKEIVQAAQKLMTLMKPQQAASGKYNTQIIGDIRGISQGDYTTVTMNFDSK